MTQDSLQQQAKALGDATRHRIFRYLVEATEAVDVAELTARFGLNHNAIRQHLVKLVEARLVIQTTAPARGRGRPRLLFEIHPVADERWTGGGRYQWLSLMLVEMLRTGATPIEVGRRAGTEEALSGGGTPTETLSEAISRDGFNPTLVSGEDKAEFMLGTCPFATAAAADPDTVCALHLGLAQGMASQLDGVVVDHLWRKDPMEAGCRLQFHLESTDA